MTTFSLRRTGDALEDSFTSAWRYVGTVYTKAAGHAMALSGMQVLKQSLLTCVAEAIRLHQASWCFLGNCL